MKQALAIGLSICLVVSLCGLASARDPARTGLRPERPWSKEEFPELNDPGLNALYQEAAVDTYCIVWYDFEDLNWQGWNRLDLTGQRGTFFHVDDFAGLGGGVRGHLIPLDGTKSMWCGARPNPNDMYLCSFKQLPGYGNAWNQVLGTPPITVAGAITWSFKAYYDSEPDYDFTHVQYDGVGLGWIDVASYTGHGDTTASYFIPITTARTKLRFHFISDGAWSDEDGLWNTDGGFIVDDIRVRDQASYNSFQDFEAAAVGANGAGIWSATVEAAFGKYSGLKRNLSIGDRDPCNYNFTTQIVFFVGSPHPNTGYPGLYDTPFCAGPGGIEPPCQNEIVYSPVIDMTKYSTQRGGNQDASIPSGDLPQLGGSILRFMVYADLPVPNLVFYQWFIRNMDAAGCPGQWETEDIIYWGGWGYGYEQIGQNVSRFVTSDKIQVAVGVIDMCDVWYLSNGNCAQHTPAPWFDNVRLYRYKTSGPQWSYRDLDLFQDNFPLEEAPPWGYVRADAANDLKTNNVPGIDPGDSIVVSCTSTVGGGIDTMPNGYPAIYMHVNAHWIGAGQPPLGAVIHGTQLQGTFGLWTNTDAGGWDIIQMDFSRTEQGVVANKYAVDLNDSLFVPGYIIEYYFTARDNAGVETALPKWARSTGPYFEFTCLPTGKSDILFVDDFTGRGSFLGAVENYWMASFGCLSPYVPPDKYDVNDPTSSVSNGPGSRANAALMRYQYKIVIWDSGDLESTTISDGTVQSDKSNDCQLLIDWMNLAEHRVGLWVCGDDIAYDLTVNDLLSTPARNLMQTWCGVTLQNTSYFDVTGGRIGGGGVIPLVTGVPGGIFVEGGVPDTWYVYGGCWVINQFDCLGKTANGVYAAAYPTYVGAPYYAAIQSEQKNYNDQWVRTMWFGFSFMYVRDAGPSWPIVRKELVQDVMAWMRQPTWYSGVENGTAPKAYKLAQNFPNPFNPVTRVQYDMKEKGLVTLKIYNVAGQLVRTLVDGVKDAGSYTALWDGKNNLGAETASGIYFYKMQAKGFAETKKMVLLR